jgi:dihydrofolate reductase
MWVCLRSSNLRPHLFFFSWNEKQHKGLRSCAVSHFAVYIAQGVSFAMAVNLVWAQSANRTIGNKGSLLWRIQEDLQRFKNLTMGNIVLMGRKTYESLPVKVRPLPGRQNVVLSHDKDYDPKHPGVVVITDLKAYLEANKDRDIWVIGGQTLYEQTLDYADTLHVTQVHRFFPGDAKAPWINPSHFKSGSLSPVYEDKYNKLHYQFIIYHRIKSSIRPLA